MNIKGMCGEQLIENILMSQKHRGVKYIQNMLVRKSSNSIAQIDFVILSKAAFIVLEVKNWNCKIYIDEYSNEWLCDYGNSKIVYAKNPINQNMMHLKCLYSITDNLYMNKVVFCEDARVIGKSAYIMTPLELTSILMSNKKRYTQQQIDDEYDMLLKHKLKNYGDYLNMVSTLKNTNFEGFDYYGNM